MNRLPSLIKEQTGYPKYLGASQKKQKQKNNNTEYKENGRSNQRQVIVQLNTLFPQLLESVSDQCSLDSIKSKD